MEETQIVEHQTLQVLTDFDVNSGKIRIVAICPDAEAIGRMIEGEKARIVKANPEAILMNLMSGKGFRHLVPDAYKPKPVAVYEVQAGPFRS